MKNTTLIFVALCAAALNAAPVRTATEAFVTNRVHLAARALTNYADTATAAVAQDATNYTYEAEQRLTGYLMDTYTAATQYADAKHAVVTQMVSGVAISSTNYADGVAATLGGDIAAAAQSATNHTDGATTLTPCAFGDWVFSGTPPDDGYRWTIRFENRLSPHGYRLLKKKISTSEIDVVSVYLSETDDATIITFQNGVVANRPNFGFRLGSQADKIVASTNVIGLAAQGVAAAASAATNYANAVAALKADATNTFVDVVSDNDSTVTNKFPVAYTYHLTTLREPLSQPDIGVVEVVTNFDPFGSVVMQPRRFFGMVIWGSSDPSWALAEVASGWVLADKDNGKFYKLTQVRTWTDDWQIDANGDGMLRYTFERIEGGEKETATLRVTPKRYAAAADVAGVAQAATNYTDAAIASASATITTNAAHTATNIVRELSLGGIWDEALQVWWTPRMRSGSLTYEATTNVNLNAGD